MADGELLHTSKSRDIDDLLMRVSRSGKTIAWKDKSIETILVRDIATGRQARFNWPDHQPTGFTISRDDKLLAAANLTDRGGLAVWNIANGRQLAAIDGIKLSETAHPYSSAFSPDTKLLACAGRRAFCCGIGRPGSRDGFWKRSRHGDDSCRRSPPTASSSPRRQTIRRVLASPQSEFGICNEISFFPNAGEWAWESRRLAFGPDGRRLVTGGVTSSQQGILKLWDTTAGREVFSAQFPMAMITAVAFSTDGRRLAAAVTPIDLSKLVKDVPSEIHVWDATPLANDPPK